VKIREAEKQDKDKIQYLYGVLCPGEPISILEERIAQIHKDNNNSLFVCEDENENILGTIFLTLCLDPMFGFRPYGVVENVIVDPMARGKGIGNKLMRHVEDICLTNNCTKIMLLSNSKRLEAHKFFEKARI
jgi:N-acetylglutamate synthase-like GNAT family acetyltransferase